MSNKKVVVFNAGKYTKNLPKASENSSFFISLEFSFFSFILFIMNIILTKNLSDILTKNFYPTPLRCSVIFDRDNPLTILLTETYCKILWDQCEYKEVTKENTKEIKDYLLSLQKWSLVILVQSTNFRLSDFRIRLELFHRWIDVLEHNHLAYIKEYEWERFFASLTYRTPQYKKMFAEVCAGISEKAGATITMRNGESLVFWPLEAPRLNSGDYTDSEYRWGTFPIGEIFSEAIDLESVNGTMQIFGYPRDDFQMEFTQPFNVFVKKMKGDFWWYLSGMI